MSKRNPGTLGIWGPNGTRVVASEAMWREPVKWNAEAACIQSFDCNGGAHSDACPQANRPRVFCASLADVFEDWKKGMSDSKGRLLSFDLDERDSYQTAFCGDARPMLHMEDVRRRLFALIDATPNLDWLLLTKRPENIRRMLVPHCIEKVPGHMSQNEGDGCRVRTRHNVWLGTSIATQADANRNIPHLLQCRDLSPVLFVSAEPLLGPIDLSAVGNCDSVRLCGENRPLLRINALTGRTDPISGLPGADTLGKLDWVIAGGESGPNARPCHPAWVRSLRDQCQAAGVPFLFKQWGEWLPMSHGGTNGACHEFADGSISINVGKSAAGRTLDGVVHDGYPKGGV